MILSIRYVSVNDEHSLAQTNLTLKIYSPDVNGRMVVAQHKGSQYGIDNGKIARKARNKNLNANEERKLIHNWNLYNYF